MRWRGHGSSEALPDRYFPNAQNATVGPHTAVHRLTAANIDPMAFVHWVGFMLSRQLEGNQR